MLKAVLLPLCLLALAFAGVGNSQSNCSSNVITSVNNVRGGKNFTVDPWIVPSTSTTIPGLLPPGVCPFASYPLIEATCKDSITFVSRAIPAGLRVHGIYLIEDVFVNQSTGDYHCPSTAMDVDLRNNSAGFPNNYTNVGVCRGETITSLINDVTRVFTPTFKASSHCSGYQMLDPLRVYVPTAPLNCSTATVTVESPGKGQPGCYAEHVWSIKLKKLVKKGTTKFLAFSCPAIAGNQPGNPVSHCHSQMTVVAKVKC